MNWRKYVPIVLISCLYAVSLVITYKIGYGKGHFDGVGEGVDTYHNLCYTNPGMMIMDNPTGTVVVCGPLTKVPEEEVRKLKPDT